jgi:hypothetical protein
LEGALASGLSASFSGAIAGAMPGLGGSILAGSFGGFSGGGFSTLLNGGGGNSAMLQGLLTGGVGGGVGAYFGGGTGAFLGGAAGGGLASLLTGDNVLSGMLAGGIPSFATYHLVNYINYLSSPLSSLEEMSYNSFARMGGDYQRAIVRHKEFGGVVYKDGTMWRANASQRRGTGVIYPKDVLEGKELAFMYHTHWSLSTKKFIGPKKLTTWFQEASIILIGALGIFHIGVDTRPQVLQLGILSMLMNGNSGLIYYYLEIVFIVMDKLVYRYKPSQVIILQDTIAFPCLHF